MFEAILDTLVELEFRGGDVINIILLVMMYFMGVKMGLFPKIKEIWQSKKQNKEEEEETKEDQTPTIHDIYQMMSELKGHFNHKTTEELETIAKHQEDMKRGVEKIPKKQDDISIDVRDIKVRQDAWHEYGIKIKKEV